MADEIKEYSCCNGHQYNSDECKEAGICPHCWPIGYGKGKMNPNSDFGPFDPGPFYNEEEISHIIYETFKSDYHLDFDDYNFFNVLSKEIVKYLDEKRKGEKHE